MTPGAGIRTVDRMRWCVAALALTSVIAACGSSGDQGDAATPPRATTATPASQRQARAAAAGCPAAGRVDMDGGYLRVPAHARAGATPLVVVVIPGGDGDPADRLGVTRAANRRGIATLYPTRAQGGFRQLNDAQGHSDVDAVKALLDRVVAAGCVAPRRISITGVSNGAGFSARMACADPARFAAVVPVAAGYRALDPCPDAAATDFLAIHGTADSVVPYGGKPPDIKGNVPRYTAAWARRDGCASPPRSSSPRRRVTRYRYPGCDPGQRVELVRLTGTRHGWLGSSTRRFPTRNPSGFSATDELLRFVAAARRPA